MFIVKIEFMVKEKVYKKGQTLELAQVPNKSRKWLQEQGIIAKVTKEELIKEEFETLKKEDAEKEEE
jgi:hypothetical protein